MLTLAKPDEALDVGVAAYQRTNIPAAILASRQAATAGHTGAMFNLGVLLAGRLDPPDLDGARRWWTQAAPAGHTGASDALRCLEEMRTCEE